MYNPLVSVIIPVYNAEKYIVETINSAINQTWSNKEIIIIDDGSTDNSYLLAKKFEAYNLKIFRQAKKGASAARNYGLREAKGEYIQYLDADDLLSNDKIHKQVLALQNEPNKIAVCKTIHFPDYHNHLSFVPSEFDDNFIFSTNDPVQFITNLWGGYNHNASMIQPNSWLTPLALIKFVDGWNESLSVDDDGEYFAKIILNSKGIIKVDGVFNYYRKHLNKDNLSSQISPKHLESRLHSTLSKKEELFSKTDTMEASQAIHRQLLELIIVSYPQYPSIYKVAVKELPKISHKYYVPVIGGKKIQKIVRLFGWKVARIIQYIFKNKY